MWYIMWVFGLLRFHFHVLPFFFFFLPMNSNLTWVHCSRIVNHYLCTVHALKNIKNGSHDTIYAFKNYFVTMFSIFSFQFSVFSFSNNKFNSNGPNNMPCVYVYFPLIVDRWTAGWLILCNLFRVSRNYHST